MKSKLLAHPKLVLTPVALNVVAAAYVVFAGVPLWLALLTVAISTAVLISAYQDLQRQIAIFRVYAHPLKGQPKQYWNTIVFKLGIYCFVSIGFTVGPLHQLRNGIPIR